MTTRPRQNNLASSQAKRQNRHLLGATGGAFMLVLAYLFGRGLENNEWVTSLFNQTVMWSILPYALAAHLLYRSVNMPAAEQRTLLLINTMTPYLLMVLIFALLQKPYARSALLLIAMLTTLWFWLVERYFQKQEKLQLIYLTALTPQKLTLHLGTDNKLIGQHIELRLWAASDDIVPACDGALVSEDHQLNDCQKQQLAILKLNHIRLYSVAAVAESLTGRKSSITLNNLLWQPDGNPAYDSFKRLVDLIIVIGLLPAWIPLGFLVAIAIKLDSKGSALYSQTRTGLHGQQFRIWKFRTMVEQKNAPAQFAQTNDNRITQLGQFLRKSRLDEIPQLANVILGHMSLIGPRPEQHTFVNEFAISIPSYPYRHLVRPGITGWAQVMQGYAASEEETAVKLSYDLYYVSHYSLALDLLIVVKTIKTILTGHGAR